VSTVAELRRQGRRRLADSAAATGPREATLLLSRVLGLSEAQLLARSEQPVSSRHAAQYGTLLERRAAGEPVAYLLGEREFYGRSFLVDRRVLIPRPETEHLVEVTLDLVSGAPASVLDVGTGSGCIAVTLALEAPNLTVFASDVSLDALDVARSNCRRLAGPGAVCLFACDLLDGLDLGIIDLVVSNPPYLAPGEAAAMTPDVLEHEPHLALFAPPDGLAQLRRLLRGARGLRPGATLALEVGAAQAPQVAELAGEQFEVARIERDYAGHERVVCLRRRAPR
jgi:release factor glutamine methyltransferase